MTIADNLDTDVQTVDAGETLSTREKIGYGLGDAGGHCISDLISDFLLFFYTDVFGLSPAIVGAMFFTLRIFRSRDGGDCRPYPQPLGAFSSVAVVDSRTAWRDRYPDVYRSGHEREHENRVGVRHLLPALHRLYRQQRALLRAD